MYPWWETKGIAADTGRLWPVSFTIDGRCPDSLARAGTLHTPHGSVSTPVFMPVGTQATVKTLAPRELAEVGASIILANTYHLYLRPRPDVVEGAGGLHEFTGWRGPILTDSGGFQVFSLAHRSKITDEGVEFQSHIDGSRHHFTPELVVRVQEQLGADIAMALDECVPFPCEPERVRAALERTHRWAVECMVAHRRPDQALFPILQGGVDPELRRESALFLSSLDFPGYAIGGLSVGEPKDVMHEMLDACVPLLPEEKPRYLMGVGSPEDLLESISRGVDMFDCALPSRIARNGACFGPEGRINLRNSASTAADEPIQEGCDCYTCRHYSRAYLRHLLKANETLALSLTTIHNLRFLIRLMSDARSAILAGRFQPFKTHFLSHYRTVDQEVQRRNREARAASFNK